MAAHLALRSLALTRVLSIYFFWFRRPLQHDRNRALSVKREHVRQLEDDLNDATMKEELHNSESTALKEEIRRLDANAKREGANLEYLKNVILKFMSSEIGKDHMFKCIAAILQFSRTEVAEVDKKAAAAASWWGSSK